MKSILKLIYSTKSTLILLLIFSLAMAVATFVEDSTETSTAMRLIYQAKWFEVVMVLLAINYIGNINKYHLLSARKFSGFIFHTAFLLILLGAGITRYFGFEGMMHVREGGSSSSIVSQNKVFRIVVLDAEGQRQFDIPVTAEKELSAFTQTIHTASRNDLIIRCDRYLDHPVTNLTENAEGGMDCVKLNVLDQGKESEVFIADQEVVGTYTLPLSFNDKSTNSGIRIFKEGNRYMMVSTLPLLTVTLPLMEESQLAANTLVELDPSTQFSSLDRAFKFIFHKGYTKAKQEFAEGSEASSKPAFITDIEWNGVRQEFPVFIDPSGSMHLQHVPIKGVSVLMGYGEQSITVPFSIALHDFSVERYPGSSNPSSYASEVVVNDPSQSEQFNYRIYMNHVLDYRGYRFFQSSYDRDEKGSIFSVNHDFWGTWITYLGYFFLALGFILTVFNKHSRFRILSRSVLELRRIRSERMVITCLALLMSTSLLAQVARKPVDANHATQFGQVVVQTFEGRFEPVHTLAYDVLHKISRKDHFNFEGKGEMDAMQVFLDVIIDPMYWKNQKLIYVREKGVQELLKIEGKYASFSDLLDANGAPKLKDKIDEAFRKKPQDQSPVDKELIKVGERFDIFMMMGQGALLRIFPGAQNGAHEWISWDHANAQTPLPDDQSAMQLLRIPVLNNNNIMGSYLNSIYVASDSGNYDRSNQIVNYITSLQRASDAASLLPTTTQVQLEEYYNTANIFVFLRNLYGLLAVIMLLLSGAELLMAKVSKWMGLLIKTMIVLSALAFAYHTFGMGLRWYLSGHAPWSNGYEALLLVGWAGLLAGFVFLRYSNIPLAATLLLAFFTLMTASHSSYDPQITNLQPVLKSYWLIIHVATLTISYGFLGLAFILGLFTLVLFLLRKESNFHRMDMLIRELTHINEMTIILGLMLATTGTFLGGVWANESWGRYWGWDAKETWALIITMVYSVVVHLRLVDKLRGDYYFTIGSILGFSTVLMTFIGVNYYLSKGMHSYGSGDTPIFPIWGWIAILTLFGLIIAAGVKEFRLKHNQVETSENN